MPRDATGDGDGSLYIRIPEHRDIVQDIEGIKQIIGNMRESIEVLNEVEQVKQKSVDVFVENVDRLNRQLEDIDGALPEVHDIEVHLERGGELAEGDDEVIDESIQELRGDLEGLRDELGRLED